MIANQGDVLGLNKISKKPSASKMSKKRTPFIKGINDAGSVDMEASSRKTTGKSVTSNVPPADVMHVVQICKKIFTRRKQ